VKALLIPLSALVLTACGGGGDSDTIACAALTSAFVNGATITSAAVRTATGVPDYCRIEGVVSAGTGSSIKFATNIPTTAWNGRFVMIGNGGYAGGPLSTSTQHLRDGYATAVTDTGHTSTAGTAFYNNRPAELDYGYRAIHLTTVVSKQLLVTNQGRAPDYAYFNGCSTGGRQGLMAAQRYPDDFNGIAAGSPAHQLTGLAVEQNWSLRKFQENNFAGNIFGKTALLNNAVKAACADAEGIINPGSCSFDPAVLACPAGTDGASCLNAAQLAAVKAVYAGPRSSTGTQWYPGKPVGSESTWANFIVANSSDPARWNPGQGGFGFSFVNNLFFENDPDPSYLWTDFNFDTDPPRQGFMAEILNATDPNLAPLQRRGAKLLVYHGTGDSLIGYQPTEQYMQNVHANMGKANADATARLFLVQGMSHCSGGDGLQVADWLAPLVQWVERGQAPDAIAATSVPSAPTAFSRPVCAWPKVATYTGSGSRLEAANWSCR
jgi:pimeloyl-ACP methyl ester carboxylesterase